MISRPGMSSVCAPMATEMLTRTGTSANVEFWNPETDDKLQCIDVHDETHDVKSFTFVSARPQAVLVQRRAVLHVRARPRRWGRRPLLQRVVVSTAEQRDHNHSEACSRRKGVELAARQSDPEHSGPCVGSARTVRPAGGEEVSFPVGRFRDHAGHVDGSGTRGCLRTDRRRLSPCRSQPARPYFPQRAVKSCEPGQGFQASPVARRTRQRAILARPFGPDIEGVPGSGCSGYCRARHHVLRASTVHGGSQKDQRRTRRSRLPIITKKASMPR